MNLPNSRICLVAAALVAGCGGPDRQTKSEPATGARPIRRVLHTKKYKAASDGVRFSAQQLVVKFHEGTAVRYRGETLAVDPLGRTADEAAVLARLDLTGEIVARDLGEINALLRKITGRPPQPLFRDLSEQRLLDLKMKGQAATGRELADLRLYFALLLTEPNPNTIRSTVDALARLRSIETVYPQPIPRGADIPPPTTIDLTASQGYLRAAPRGIDVDFARLQPGGLGEGVRIIDVESGWHLDHEDLPGPGVIFSWHGLSSGDYDHGTAVAGVLWAQDNGYGITGIVPRSGMGWSSVVGASFPNFIYLPAAAIANAAADLFAGDIILIEQHMPPADYGIVSEPGPCNPDQTGYLPVEYYGAEFDAISTATANGIIVIEAAGNGTWNLDSVKDIFDRSVRDSGAIIVAATQGRGALSPACFTNHGSRIDANGWGGGVATLGFGVQKANGDDPLQWYTDDFGGTSSASPIVAGAAALVQSIRAGSGLPRLSPAAMRSLLTSTGTQQTAGPRIGTQPNLKAALRSTLPDRTGSGRVTVPTQAAPGQSFSGTARFVNAGPFDWTAATHTMRCQWLPQGSGPDPAVAAISGTITRGVQAASNITGKMPSTSGAFSLQCFLVSGSNIVGSALAAVLLSSPGTNYDARIESIGLPATMPYGLNGNSAGPVRFKVTVRNTGTTAWTPGQVSAPQLHFSWSRDPDHASMPVTTTVAPGSAVEFEGVYQCESPGSSELIVQMRIGAAAFGTPGKKASRCLGVERPPDDPN